MTKLFITILIAAFALNYVALGAPAPYGSPIRGAKNILEGDAVVPELYARDPFFGRIFRGIKKGVGMVRKVISTARQVVNTASRFASPVGAIARLLPRELEEVSEREYHDELFDRELDNYLFEREYDEEVVRDFNDASMDGLD